MHIGFFDLDEAQLCARVELDGARVGLFADDLLVNLGFRRHVDDEIAHDLRLARQAAAGGKTANPVIAFLDL